MEKVQEEVTSLGEAWTSGTMRRNFQRQIPTGAQDRQRWFGKDVHKGSSGRPSISLAGKDSFELFSFSS